MKTIGMIGGMSWESTQTYYQLLNQGVKARLGGLHSARCLLASVDFAEFEELQHTGQWEEAGARMASLAQQLERGGADFLIICTNTMHKSAPQVEQAVRLPLLHIADATGQVVRAAGITRVGLLGTRFTMEEDFYRGRLRERFGLEVCVPDPADRETVHRVIYDELCLGIIKAESREAYRRIIRRLVDDGAQGIILGCTEIGLLVDESDSPVPLFDTTVIHARAAVAYALED